MLKAWWNAEEESLVCNPSTVPPAQVLFFKYQPWDKIPWLWKHAPYRSQLAHHFIGLGTRVASANNKASA